MTQDQQGGHDTRPAAIPSQRNCLVSAWTFLMHCLGHASQPQQDNAKDEIPEIDDDPMAEVWQAMARCWHAPKPEAKAEWTLWFQGKSAKDVAEGLRRMSKSGKHRYMPSPAHVESNIEQWLKDNPVMADCLSEARPEHYCARCGSHSQGHGTLFAARPSAAPPPNEVRK